MAVFKAARAAGLLTGFVSNGHGTPRVLDYLAPWIDLFKVDLKGFDELQYRNYGGQLAPVLETIRELHARGIWVEVVTLRRPGPQQLRRGTRASSPRFSPACRPTSRGTSPRSIPTTG